MQSSFVITASGGDPRHRKHQHHPHGPHNLLSKGTSHSAQETSCSAQLPRELRQTSASCSAATVMEGTQAPPVEAASIGSQGGCRVHRINRRERERNTKGQSPTLERRITRSRLAQRNFRLIACKNLLRGDGAPGSLVGLLAAKQCSLVLLRRRRDLSCVPGLGVALSTAGCVTARAR
jgi:hypothetical protein